MSTSFDSSCNMALPPLGDDRVNDFNYSDLDQLSQPLVFGTDDLMFFDFMPPDVGPDYALPYYMQPTPDQPALGTGNDNIASYGLPSDIGMAGAYGSDFAQPSPFFHMGLGGTMAGNFAPNVSGYDGGEAFGTETIPHEVPAWTSTALDQSDEQTPSMTMDPPTPAYSPGSPPAAGPSMRSASAVNEVGQAEHPQVAAATDAWSYFVWRLDDVAAATGSTTVDAASNRVDAQTSSTTRQPYAMLGPAYHGSQSQTMAARTSPGGAPFDLAATSAALTASEHFGHAYAPSDELSEQLGPHVQEFNTLVTPAVTGLKPRAAHPAASPRTRAARAPASSKARRAKAPASSKTARPSKARAQKAAKAQASKATRKRAPKTPKNPFPRVPWENSERGRMCVKRELSEDSPGPFQCFICVEHSAPGASKWYDEWKSFKSHVGRCAPVETMLPRCHFCHERIAAYGRPHQMERHLVGYDGYPACKALADLVHGGKKTHFALGSWLKAKKLPILPEFVGRRLAKAFHWAVYDKYERDKVADLTPQHRKPKKKANKGAGEERVEEDDDDDDDDDEE